MYYLFNEFRYYYEEGDGLALYPFEKKLGCCGIRTQDHSILRQTQYPLRYRTSNKRLVSDVQIKI